MGFWLNCVDQVGKLHCILDEEHRDVITNDVEVSILRVEFDSKPTHIAREIQGPNLAAAYGMAVTATMLITTVLLCVVARRRWGWRWERGVALLALAFLPIDTAFLAANVFKVDDGGWFVESGCSEHEPNGDGESDLVVTEGGVTFIRNTDVTEARYRWVSVREIQAP